MIMKNYLRLIPLAIIIVLGYSCHDNVPYYDVRDEYIGDYNVYDDCGAFTSDYSLTLFKYGNSNEIIFGFPGLYEAGFEVTGLVTGMKVVIPVQQFSIAPDVFYEFSGSGSLNDTVLTMAYQVLTIQGTLIIDEVDCIAELVRWQ